MLLCTGSTEAKHVDCSQHAAADSCAALLLGTSLSTEREPLKVATCDPIVRSLGWVLSSFPPERVSSPPNTSQSSSDLLGVHPQASLAASYTLTHKCYPQFNINSRFLYVFVDHSRFWNNCQPSKKRETAMSLGRQKLRMFRAKRVRLRKRGTWVALEYNRSRGPQKPAKCDKGLTLAWALYIRVIPLVTEALQSPALSSAWDLSRIGRR